MTDSASVSREHNGSGSTGTLDNDTTTFAILEVLIPWDATNMKSQRRGYGFTDISPLWADKPQVPTFMSDPKVIARWPEFQAEFCGVDAHWYYVSGHHSRQFASDNTDDAEDDARWQKMLLTNRATGFFNEPYHVGPWEHHVRTGDGPLPPNGPKDVFFHTARDDLEDPPHPRDNPLYHHVHSAARGVMMAACNTLTYTQARKLWAKYFPNAVIMGLLTRESCSSIQYAKIGQKFGKKFYTEPYREDITEDLVKLINPNPRNTEFDRIGVIWKGTLWYRRKDKSVTSIPVDGPTPFPLD